jgi:hypothetical protein
MSSSSLGTQCRRNVPFLYQSSPSADNNVIDILKLGNWQAGGITCLEARDYLINFLVSEDSCQTFQQIGVHDCGCTDLLPTPSPTTSPTFVDEVKIDCEALAKGIFPTIDSDYVSSTDITYSMELQLAEGYSFDDVASPLQDQMDIIVSLDVNDHCSSSSVRRLEIERKLENMIIHYVDFENLTDGGGGKFFRVVCHLKIFYASWIIK